MYKELLFLNFGSNSSSTSDLSSEDQKQFSFRNTLGSQERRRTKPRHQMYYSDVRTIWNWSVAEIYTLNVNTAFVQNPSEHWAAQCLHSEATVIARKHDIIDAEGGGYTLLQNLGPHRL